MNGILQQGAQVFLFQEKMVTFVVAFSYIVGLKGKYQLKKQPDENTDNATTGKEFVNIDSLFAMDEARFFFDIAHI
jgi:hypothetical protein